MSATATATETDSTRAYGPFSTTRDETDEERERMERGLVGNKLGLVKKVVAEQAVVSVAGLTAVLLQIAHPGVGKGVGDHSNFSHRFIERSENTAMYIYTVVFGTEEEKARMKAFVDRRHAWVNDRRKGGGGSGGTYDALDPEMQLWVAATLYATYVPVYESIFGAFSPSDAELLLQEFSIMGTALQVPLRMWPRSVAAFWEYFDGVVERTLEMTPQCARTAGDLRAPVRSVPWYYKPLLFLTTPLHWNATTENLPPRARALFDLKSTPATRRMHAVGMAALRATVPLYPVAVRTWPKNYYLGMARRKMGKGRM